MTVNNNASQLTSYQSISYSSFRVNVFSATSQTTANSASSASQPTDTVSLSPEASSQAAAGSTDTSASKPQSPGHTTTVSTVATEVSATYYSATTVSSTSAASKDDAATALFKALDADQDGSVTEDEFKAGAKALLRQGRRGDHPEGVRHGEHDHRGGRRLDRALGRVFDAVDGNGDGNITKDELSAALAKTSNRTQASTGTTQAPPPLADPTGPTASQSGAAGSSAASFVSVTVVSVAIRSYTSISQVSTDASNKLVAPPPNTAKPAAEQTLPLAA